MQVLDIETTATTAPAATLDAAPAARFDCYAGIHKALRLCLSRTLVRVGSADPSDEAEVAQAVQAVHALLDLSEDHMAKEDAFMHPLLEQAQPGSTAAAMDDHLAHEAAIEQLRALADAAAAAGPQQRARALSMLYAALAGYVAKDLRHMQHEETVHNALLWARYSDAELQAVEGRIVASIPPHKAMALLPWFMPALNAPERLKMLAGMRAMAPAPAFEAALGIARDVLSQVDFGKLAAQLGVAPMPGLVTAPRS
ncbi:hemerythrin domain-containing protein [Ramlibacter sp. AN1015]|uniref:hemerythrin domain-containing protein n=1 Tax=Ramlibacter sp. AN1015 TaxID=3133428 RepID=UPI0030BF972E